MPKSSNSALIGYTGFVGSTLLKQRSFTHLYRSTNIAEIAKQKFDVVICAGAPAQKWLANQDPVSDLQKINSLISYLDQIECNQFILISTVDVFKNPVGVDEKTPINETDLQPYGLHRRMLEKFVEQRFQHLIIRLPGLVGSGLRKNIIFDLLNHNNLHNIDSRNVFQFYPMYNLWYDIQAALTAKISLIHFTTEPISVQTVAELGFGREFNQKLSSPTMHYDLHSIWNVLGGDHNYHYNKREVIQAIRAYAQSEPLTSSQGKQS